MHELIKCIQMWSSWICTNVCTTELFSFTPTSFDISLQCVWGCVCVCAHTGSSSCTTLLWMVLNASHTHNDRRSVSSVSNLTQGEGLHPSVLPQCGTPLPLLPFTHLLAHTEPPILYTHRHPHTTTHPNTHQAPPAFGKGTPLSVL